MQQDLENLAKEIRVLQPFERRIQILILKSYCDKIIDTHIQQDAHKLKRQAIEETFAFLNKDALRDGINTLLSIPREEREKFYEDVFKKAPHKIGTHIDHLVSARQMERVPF